MLKLLVSVNVLKGYAFSNIFSINEDVFSLNVQAFFCDSYLKRGHLQIPFVPENIMNIIHSITLSNNITGLMIMIHFLTQNKTCLLVSSLDILNIHVSKAKANFLIHAFKTIYKEK